MPYALPERQREYQRQWMRKRAKKKTHDLRHGVVTWEQLQSLSKYDDIKSFRDCVKEARGLIGVRQVNRLSVAALAVRACKIRRGGDFRSDAFLSGQYGKTLSEFAKEVGINPKTIHSWVNVKVTIFDKLTKKEDFDFTAAQLIERNGNLTRASSEDKVSAYYELRDNTEARQAINTLKYLASAVSAIRACRRVLTKSQLEAIRAKYAELGDLLKS